MPITLSPLRYPGGKTKLYKYTKNLIYKNNLNECTYVETFAGGAGLALELLVNEDVSKLILNDLDPSIYTLWFNILNNPKELSEKIMATEITVDEWYAQKKIQENKFQLNESIDLAFSTLFLNRTNRSGILKAGPIGGYKQESKYKIDCRFNKEKIIKKIYKIYSYRDVIYFYNLDAEVFIDEVIKKEKEKLFCFFDPPYYEKGPELYVNHYLKSDHERLGNKIKSIDNYWITTYDNAEEIKEIYKDKKIIEFNLNYSAGKSKKGTEIMIFSDRIKSINFDD